VRAVSTLAGSGDDVRCAVLEMLGEIIYVFDRDESGPPLELLAVYMDDVDGHPGRDADWDVIAAFNVSPDHNGPVCMTDK
jgi:serine/threonine-protein phosphatase 4 regulatory subunit 1